MITILYKMRNSCVVNLHIYVARTNFLLFYYDYMMTKTLNMSNQKYKWAYLNLYSEIYIYQKLYGKMVFMIYNMGAKCWVNSSYFCSCSHNSAILWWLYDDKKHWIGVIGNTKQHISTKIHPYKHIKGSIGQWYPYSIIWENIVVIIHIYVARTISYYFMMTLWLPRHWIRGIGNKNEHISTNIHPYMYIEGYIG